MKRLCRNCHRATISRPRGLCWHCYYTPGVRKRFPPTSKYAVNRATKEGARAPLAPTLCKCLECGNNLGTAEDLYCFSCLRCSPELMARRRRIQAQRERIEREMKAM